ncbi:hypothetical protein Tco_0035241 [Tanacetum coccineum]
MDLIFYCCEYCGGLHDSSNCQYRNQVFYEPNPCNDFDSSGFDQPSQYPIVHPSLHEMSLQELISYMPPLIAETANRHMDKGKGIMIEEPVVEKEKPMKKQEQMRIDEELAFKLQAEEEEEEERHAREKAQQMEEANIDWDDIQAEINADYQLAQRLQAQEQDELTDEEKARLFVQFLKQRRKHFTAKRTEEKRNRPPTRAQQRSIMSTYLKNMEGWKP